MHGDSAHVTAIAKSFSSSDGDIRSLAALRKRLAVVLALIEALEQYAKTDPATPTVGGTMPAGRMRRSERRAG
jgi:hypothetical protein